MLKELHARETTTVHAEIASCKYGQKQGITNFKTTIYCHEDESLRKKRKRYGSIAQRAAMKHCQYKTQRGGRGTERQPTTPFTLRDRTVL